MKQLVRCISMTAAVLLMTLMLAPGIASAVTTWTVMRTPANDNVGLSSVSCTSLSRCMAISDGNPNTSTYRTYAWNGSTWAPTAHQPTVSDPNDYGLSLNGLACTSATYCMAVGGHLQVFRSRAGGSRPLVERHHLGGHQDVQTHVNIQRLERHRVC